MKIVPTNFVLQYLRFFGENQKKPNPTASVSVITTPQNSVYSVLRFKIRSLWFRLKPFLVKFFVFTFYLYGQIKIYFLLQRVVGRVLHSVRFFSERFRARTV